MSGDGNCIATGNYKNNKVKLYRKNDKTYENVFVINESDFYFPIIKNNL